MSYSNPGANGVIGVEGEHKPRSKQSKERETQGVSDDPTKDGVLETWTTRVGVRRLCV